MVNDTSLWNKLKQGDLRSFELIFKIYYPQLCLFANKYTHDFDLAKEVVQDLFVYLWENRDKLKEKDSIKSYLFAAVRFNSIRRYNDQKRNKIEIIDLPEDAFKIEFLDDIEFAELQEVIFETINSLPTQCQKIFKMSRFENMTYLKIAEVLSISPKTVEAQMSKALKILQKTFDDYLLGIIISLFI